MKALNLRSDAGPSLTCPTVLATNSAQLLRPRDAIRQYAVASFLRADPYHHGLGKVRALVLGNQVMLGNQMECRKRCTTLTLALPFFFTRPRLLRMRRRIRLVIFNNLLPDHVPIHEKFDLKGSTLGRWAVRQMLTLSNQTSGDFMTNNPVRNLVTDGNRTTRS